MRNTFGVGEVARGMTKRRWLVLAAGLGCISVAAAVLVWFRVIASGPLEVTVRNETGTAISGLALVSGTGFRTPLSDVAAGGSITVKPRVGGSEDDLDLVDGQGKRYLVLDYFEGDPGGQLTIVITGTSDQGLTGRVNDETDYFPAGESTLSLATR